MYKDTAYSELAKCSTEVQLGGLSTALTLKERADAQIADLSNRLANLQELKTLLENNPDVERLLTLTRGL